MEEAIREKAFDWAGRFSDDIEETIKERAFELADKYSHVDEDKAEVILRRMAAEGNDLIDLEDLESEISFDIRNDLYGDNDLLGNKFYERFKN